MTRTLNYVIVTTFSKIKLMQIVKLIASHFPVVRINFRYKCEEDTPGDTYTGGHIERGFRTRK